MLPRFQSEVSDAGVLAGPKPTRTVGTTTVARGRGRLNSGRGAGSTYCVVKSGAMGNATAAAVSSADTGNEAVLTGITHCWRWR